MWGRGKCRTSIGASRCIYNLLVGGSCMHGVHHACIEDTARSDSIHYEPQQCRQKCLLGLYRTSMPCQYHHRSVEADVMLVMLHDSCSIHAHDIGARVTTRPEHPCTSVRRQGGWRPPQPPQRMHPRDEQTLLLFVLHPTI